MTEAEHRAWWTERTDVAYGLCWCGCGEATSISTRTDRSNGYACGRPFAYVRGHATALQRRTKVESLPEPNPSGLCMCGCGQKTSLAKQTKTQAGWVRGKSLPFLPNHFPRKLTKEQEAEACRRYVEGETCKEIGVSFGVSRKTVTRVLECHGVSIRPKSTPRPDLRLLSLDEETEICQRYEAGESSDALGKAFGVSGITVRKALERNGVQRRPGVAGAPLTSKQRAEICRRYVEGEHHKAIAEAFDIEPGTVYRVLKREGVSPRIVPYTEEQRDEVCRRYLAGDEIRAICEATGMNTSGLYAVLRDNHIERDRTVWANEAEEAKICRRYAEGESGPVLARDFGVTDGAILGVLQRHGVPRRSGSEALRRYSCDHSFFDEIDTEAKAYWLGFIAADGCVTDKNVLSISLSSRDHDHLLRFKADLQASHPVASYMATTKPPGSREARTASVSSISIASPQLAGSLASQGIVPRKTFVLRWPEHLPPELLRHFLRGYTDGDGCFHVSRSSYVRKRDSERATHLNWSIIGTEPLCSGARRYLGQAVEVSEIGLRPHSESPGIFTLHYGGNRQVSRIYHLLYDDVTVFLPRKREVARPYALPLAEARPYGPSRSQAVEMRRMYEAGQSSTAIGERFGFSGGTVLEALRRQGVEVRPSASTSPFPEEQRAAICERYLVGESSEKIAKEMKVSASVVLNILERCGIQRRSASESKRRYQCDHGFFDAVDTEEQAYWLGFVASNGRVSGNQLTISCVPEDREHLLELKSAMRSTYPLRDRSGSPTFYMKSMELVSALRSHGMTVNKRRTLSWPGHLGDDLLRHYLRGYADGGGGFVLNHPQSYKLKGWKPMINFGITSTQEFLQGCQEYLIRASKLSRVRFVKTGPRSSPSLRYGGGRQASRIWHLLYDGAAVYLPRKREVAVPYVI